ncbi:MAG: phosphatase PAP2 family protein [Abitibacteriaceae bacterium]|nr:phosphatase PAP2 family protein [Abditibacteriaceae bacterium]
MYKQLLRRNALSLLFLFCGILLPLLILGSLTAQVRGNQLVPGDIAGLHFVHRYSTAERDKLVAFATIAGGLIALPGICTVIVGLRFLKQAESALFFAVTVVGAWGLNLLAKVCFQRARPTLWQSPTPRSDYSFPSGHAMISMAIAVCFIIIAWPTRSRWLAFSCGSLGTLVIGLSRLYLGVHFPSDVIAGWCAGLLWTMGVYWILRRNSSLALINTSSTSP